MPRFHSLNRQRVHLPWVEFVFGIVEGADDTPTRPERRSRHIWAQTHRKIPTLFLCSPAIAFSQTYCSRSFVKPGGSECVKYPAQVCRCPAEDTEAAFPNLSFLPQKSDFGDRPFQAVA